MNEEFNRESTPAIVNEQDLRGEIAQYRIENANGTALIVSNLGAAVTSIFTRDRHGKLGDIVLGYDNLLDYLNDDYYIGTVIGRYANRIAGNTVKIDGHTYQLTTKDGNYHQHGGSIGFNKKIFKATPFKQDGKSGLTLRYTSPHLEEGFPGELQVEIVYTLDDADEWSIEYRAVSSKTTLVNLTQHTYFNLGSGAIATIDGHELMIPCGYYLPVDGLQVPTGSIEVVDGTPFDFRAYKNIGQDISLDHEQLTLSKGYDHSFVLEREHTSSLKHAAVVREPLTGREMDVYTSEPAIHFYSGNFLNEVKGKNGAIYNRRSGFCLETQHFPDAPNHPHFPSTELKAGEQFYSKTVIRFSAG